jgi:outer membrane protein
MKFNMIHRFVASIAAVALVTGAAVAQTPGRGPETLTIDDAVRIASERNLTIVQAQTSVESEGAAVTGAFGAFLPRLTVTSGYNRQLSDGSVFVGGVAIPNLNQPTSSYDIGASADLLLFDGFSRTANYNSAQSRYSAALQTLNRTRQDVVFQARSAFLNAIRTEQIIEIRRSDLDIAREQLNDIRGRVDAGTAQIGSVYTQEAEVANNELSLAQAETDALVARNTLKLAMNVDPSTDFQLSSEGLAKSVDSTEIATAREKLGTIQQMYDAQVSHRLDLQAAKLRIDAASTAVTAARAGYFPTISTGLRWDWQKSGEQTRSQPQFNLSFNYTPFDQFATNYQVQTAEAQRQQAEIDARKLELQARSDLQQALARLDGAERQLSASQRAIIASRQSRYAADERYRLGAGSYTDYLLANGQYLTAQINQVNAIFNYRLALYEVMYQLGE